MTKSNYVENPNLAPGTISTSISNIRATTIEEWIDSDLSGQGIRFGRNTNASGNVMFMIPLNFQNAFEITSTNTTTSGETSDSTDYILRFNTRDDNIVRCKSNLNISGDINVLNNNL